MFLFKASGKTYRKVIKHSLHAFPYAPSEVNGDELVLLSKNREDCTMAEKQVQTVAKLLKVQRATPELDRVFPDVQASKRWKYEIRLYWVRRLSTHFNLNQIVGLNAKHYNTVQGFARLTDGDDLALVRYLAKTNPDVLLDILNNAERPGGDGAC